MRVGVFGATGQVGGLVRRLLQERSFPVDEMRYFASERSAGRTLPWGDGEVTVENAATADYSGIDFALVSFGKYASKELAPSIAAAGAIVIDNSSAWRMDPTIPLGPVRAFCEPPHLDAAADLLAGAEKYLKPIPGVLSFHVGKMVPSHRPVVDQSYQVALNLVFPDKKAQDDYQVHPMHVEFVEQVFKVNCARCTVYDFA